MEKQNYAEIRSLQVKKMKVNILVSSVRWTEKADVSDHVSPFIITCYIWCLYYIFLFLFLTSFVALIPSCHPDFCPFLIFLKNFLYVISLFNISVFLSYIWWYLCCCSILAVVSVEQHLRLQHVAPACSPGSVPGPGGDHHLAGGAGPLVGDRTHHLPGTVTKKHINRPEMKSVPNWSNNTFFSYSLELEKISIQLHWHFYKQRQLNPN